MDDLRSFSAGLRLTLKHMVGATDTAPYRSHRPFVSKGSPLDCRVFIVGFNPARSNVGFGEFWDDNYGFRYDLWHSAYLANNGNRLSPTRQRLERVVQAANSVHILETNLYSFPTPRASDLRMPNRQSDCLSFLVETLKPKLIITHGAKVWKDLNSVRLRPLHARLLGIKPTIVPFHHFMSRGAQRWTEPQLDALGMQIKNFDQTGKWRHLDGSRPALADIVMG